LAFDILTTSGKTDGKMFVPLTLNLVVVVSLKYSLSGLFFSERIVLISIFLEKLRCDTITSAKTLASGQRDLPHGNVAELKKPSLEVAPTTLRPVLLI